LAGLWLNFQPVVDQFLGVVGADLGQENSLGGALAREVGNRLSILVGAPDRDHPVRPVLDALGIHLVGVVAAGVPAPARHAHPVFIGALTALAQLQRHLSFELWPCRVAVEYPAIHQPRLFICAECPDSPFITVILSIYSADQHHRTIWHAREYLAAPVYR